jgi:type II secretory pathway component PulF
MAALAIGLGGAVGELWVQDGLLLLLALGLCSFSGWRLYQRNNSQQSLEHATAADAKAITLATRFGYTLPNAYKSLSSALKALSDQTSGKRKRKLIEARLKALKASAVEAKARSQAMKGNQPSAYDPSYQE